MSLRVPGILASLFSSKSKEAPVSPNQSIASDGSANETLAIGSTCATPEPGASPDKPHLQQGLHDNLKKPHSDVTPTSSAVVTKDLGFLPIPTHLRHHPDRPHQWTLSLNIVFGVASTFLVANLYYCQPLLIQLSNSFGVSYNEVSRIPTLVQAGYAVGLLFISPLGDLVRRRPLILLLTFLTASLSIGLPLARSIVAFETLSFLIGVVTVVPQVLMPFAADLAPPERRGSALSIVLSGLLFGILFARVAAGVIAQFVIWRVVYYVAVGLQFAVLVMMWFTLPDYPQRNKGLTYWGILSSMAKFAVTEPLLIQAVLVNIASMATFTSFWVTLTFLLGGPPYNYSTLIIGLFGLVGMLGVCLAPFVGKTVDKLHPWSSSTLASIALLLFFAIQTGAGGISIAAVIIVCFGIDVFRQMQQVSLTSNVFGLESGARSRLNAVMVISIFIGQVMGTSVGTRVFTKHGWRAAGFLSVGWCSFCFFIMLIRGPNVKRYTWVGWEGGWEIRKSRLAARGAGEQTQSAAIGEGNAETEKDAVKMQVEDITVRRHAASDVEVGDIQVEEVRHSTSKQRMSAMLDDDGMSTRVPSVVDLPVFEEAHVSSKPSQDEPHPKSKPASDRAKTTSPTPDVPLSSSRTGPE